MSPTIADFSARVTSHPLLARSLLGPPEPKQLAVLRKRTGDVPLGLADIYAQHDGAVRPGGLFAFLTTIIDGGAAVPWLSSATWISIADGERDRDDIVDEGWELADSDVVIGRGKADHTWLVAGSGQIIRALLWRTRGPHRQRGQLTAKQTWPQLIEAFCAARGTFSLQDRQYADADDERTLMFEPR